MFGNLGFGELMIILVIVLVLFGAKRIPEISASFGKGIREFKKNVNDVEGSLMGSNTNDIAPPRYDNRLPPADPLAQREPVPPTTEESRPEPKRLL
jgi:sec-independent protein translocase protein TatA